MSSRRSTPSLLATQEDNLKVEVTVEVVTVVIVHDVACNNEIRCHSRFGKVELCPDKHLKPLHASVPLRSAPPGNK